MNTNPRKGWPTTILAIASVGSLGAGGLIGLAVSESSGTPKSCSAAFTHAEETMSLYYGALQSAGDGIDGAHRRDSDVINTATDEITRYSELLGEEILMYHELKEQCIEGE